MITQKEFTAYKEFISRFVPKEKSSDPKLMKASRKLCTELMLVKAAAKAEGHGTDEMLGRVLSSLAAQNNITVDELKENMAKDKIDPKLFAEISSHGAIAQRVIKLQFEGSFAPEQAQVSAERADT